MSKPILYIHNKYKESHLERIKEIAPNYKLVKAKKISKADLGRVEIIYGVDKKLINRILDLPKEERNLKFIQIQSAGADILPDRVLAEDDIIVATMSGIHKETIAETILGFILSYYHNLFTYQRDKEKKNWNQIRNVRQLKGKRVLLFGTGNIAQQTAKMINAFGGISYGINTSGRQVEHFKDTRDLDHYNELVDEADIIINTLPDTSDTKKFFNVDFFSKLKNPPIFINIGRGASVVEEDLIHALEFKQIEAAYIDVFKDEPLPEKSKLWKAKNLYFSPHVSGMIEHFADACFEIFEPNLISYLEEGKPKINVVDKDAGY